MRLLTVFMPCTQDVEDLLAASMEKRTVGCTQLNEQSSRSHAVFTLKIEGANDSSKLKVRCCRCYRMLLADPMEPICNAWKVPTSRTITSDAMCGDGPDAAVLPFLGCFHQVYRS
eukprot:GHUV01026936.1.p2 GENE.GHUV01026936.1~~GHUV01026936.1.p2  ORF type:complete len:115 (+),score=11.26 GHUV01026936.1:82-426(+)